MNGGRGRVEESLTEKTMRTIGDNEAACDTSESAPAYLIEQHNGDHLLELPSEVRKDF